MSDNLEEKLILLIKLIILRSFENNKIYFALYPTHAVKKKKKKTEKKIGLTLFLFQIDQENIFSSSLDCL